MDDEFILLDEYQDKYYFLDENDSILLLNGLVKNERNFITEKCLSTGLLIVGSLKENIKIVTSNRTGVGNYEWKNVLDYREKNFHTGHIILAVLLLFFIKFHLKFGGFGRILATYRKLANCNMIRKKNSNRMTSLKKISGAIYEASCWLPFRVQCLESSLALFLVGFLLRIECKFKIGVQRYDFLAHAWIEVDGHVIGDSPMLNLTLPTILEI